jgi:hypothetical protein
MEGEGHEGGGDADEQPAEAHPHGALGHPALEADSQLVADGAGDTPRHDRPRELAELVVDRHPAAVTTVAIPTVAATSTVAVAATVGMARLRRDRSAVVASPTPADTSPVMSPPRPPVLRRRRQIAHQKPQPGRQ